jgi:hypothetical protein
MRDSVSAVREEAINALKFMATILEKSWIDAHILEFIEPFSKEKDHTLRLNYFFAIQKLAKNISFELQKRLVYQVEQKFSDPLANVRIAAVSTLSSLLALMKEKKSRVVID